MTTTRIEWTAQEIEEFVARAKQIYRNRLASVLEPEHDGEIVAIIPETGLYFLGADEIDASNSAREAGYDGPFYFSRVGSDYTHRLMTPRQ